jgi:hypothetical protein
LKTKTTLFYSCAIAIISLGSCQFLDEKQDGNSGKNEEMKINYCLASDACDATLYNYVAVERENMVDTPKIELGVKKMIKDGLLSFKCSDLAASKHAVDSLLAKVGGYYEEENARRDDERNTYNLKLRLPSAQFESFMTSLEGGKDELMRKEIDARDITAEYIDVEKRLANQRAHLEQYQNLRSQARTVEDMVAVQEHMEALQTEIEGKEGQMKYWNDQIAWSTIHVELYTEFVKTEDPDKEESIVDRTWNSLVSGIEKVVDLLFFLVRFWPFVLTILGVWWYRRRKKKTANTTPTNGKE